MTNTCALSALWGDLALAATLRAIWLKDSTRLPKLRCKKIASPIFFPFRPQARNQHRKFYGPTLPEGHR